jgi:uncharacterized protein
MMNGASYSDEHLNSFVDNELGSGDKSEILEMMGRDDALKEQVCELRSLKEMIKYAYPKAVAGEASEKWVSNRRPIWQQALNNTKRLAACVLLFLMGGASGWFVATRPGLHEDAYAVYISKASNSAPAGAAQRNIVFQVSNSNPIRLKATLDEAESLLKANGRSHGQLKVEIIANSDGVNLLRAETSPYAQRIGMMKAKYPNLDFLACNRTISNLRNSGIAVHLLPNTEIAPSAAEEISTRLHQGWDYARM